LIIAGFDNLWKPYLKAITAAQPGGADDFADQQTAPPWLPSQSYLPTSFIGRKKKFAPALLFYQTTRCLTLTGMGGIGKTPPGSLKFASFKEELQGWHMVY